MTTTSEITSQKPQNQTNNWLSSSYLKAKKITKKNINPIKATYGTLDGFTNAYSFTKSWFDITYCAESNATSFDAMHNWLVTPAGLIISIVESLFFAGLFAYGNYHDDNKSESANQTIVKTHKYFRETAQSGRNAFKANRNALLTANLFLAQNIRNLILPFGLVFSGLYILSRLIFLDVKDIRKKMTEDYEAQRTAILSHGNIYHLKTLKLPNRLDRIKYKNNYLLLPGTPGNKPQLYFVHNNENADTELVKDTHVDELLVAMNKQPQMHFSLLQLSELLPAGVALKHYSQSQHNKKIAEENPESRANFLLMKCFNGAIDAAYLLLTVITLAPLAPHLLIIATVFSALYCLTLIASRISEEYNEQSKLKIKQYELQLTLSSKELEAQFIQLNDLALRLSKETDAKIQQQLKNEQKKIHFRLDQELIAFELARKALRKASQPSPGSTILLGLNYGIHIYGAWISIISTVIILTILLNMPFITPFIPWLIPLLIGFAPIIPSLVFACIITGIPMLLGGIAFAFLSTNTLQKPDETVEQKRVATLCEYIQKIKESPLTAERERFHTELRTAATLDTLSKQAKVLEGAEVIRSSSAGLLKGKKIVEFWFTSMQSPDSQGHFQDSAAMLFLMIPLVPIYSAVFALKAFIKGFITKSKAPAETIEHCQYWPKKDIQTTAAPLKLTKETIPESPKRTPSPQQSSSLLIHGRLFSPKNELKSPFIPTLPAIPEQKETTHQESLHLTRSAPPQDESTALKPAPTSLFRRSPSAQVLTTALPSPKEMPDIIAGSEPYHYTF